MRALLLAALVLQASCAVGGPMRRLPEPSELSERDRLQGVIALEKDLADARVEKDDISLFWPIVLMIAGAALGASGVALSPSQRTAESNVTLGVGIAALAAGGTILGWRIYQQRFWGTRVDQLQLELVKYSAAPRLAPAPPKVGPGQGWLTDEEQLPPAPRAPPPTVAPKPTGGCTAPQIADMIKLGLTREQVLAACPVEP